MQGAFWDLKEKKDMIAKTFRTCGYYDEDPNTIVDEISNFFENMDIEDVNSDLGGIALDEDQPDSEDECDLSYYST